MKVQAIPTTFGRAFTGLFVWAVMAGASFAAPYLAVNGASHDYLTLHYYINEPADSESLLIEFWPDAANVAEAQIWSNLGRRDLATLNDQDAASVPGPAPASANYFVGFPLTNAGGGKWTATFPIDKTGAYRLTARYRLTGQSTWQWVGGRDTAVVVSPKKSRDVVLYELQVNAINATGDTEGTRSTFEDLMNPSKPANLDYFANLGVNTLWIQPIHPIGDHPCISKAEGPGSPYSIQNMWEVAPHMSAGNTRAASMVAFTNFAAAAKARNIDFFFDIIFNHTSWDAEIGRDPANPSVPAANPTAKIKDLLPQWYSRFNGSTFPCGEYDYTQSQFEYSLPAGNSSQIGPAPAERNDFGKWPDVADLFWGTYPALTNPQTDTDTFWDVSQPGADVKRMVEYFTYFGEYWIEKSGGTLGGFRCDYAQGIPPQAWEYMVNKIRKTKWDFVFMAESLDGGAVSKRAGRHMDIINQNWVWQVLENGGNTLGLRGVIDQAKTDYGYAGIMRGLVNHDQNAPADKWYTFSRYAVGAVIDGAPQLYQGQELGYVNNWGFSRFRNQFNRFIPDIFKWHNMQPLWSNRDGVLEDAYQRVNRGRALNIATRLHDQFYLNRTGGQGAHPDIFSVLKYEKTGWDPADQNVVLSFVNLVPWSQRGGTFDIAEVHNAGKIYLNPTRFYNVRNLTSDNPNQQLWPSPGRTGQQLINEGFFVDMPQNGLASPQYAFVQMLKLEEHQTEPVDPHVTWEPQNPVGCNVVTVRYAKASSPLGAGPVNIFIGRNNWQDIVDPHPQMANNGDHWVYYHSVAPGTDELNFVFHNGSGAWDNNNEADWKVLVADCEGSDDPIAWTDPAAPNGCGPITVYYNPTGRPLASASQVRIHVGRNGWQNVIDPDPLMTLSNGVWKYVYTPPPGTEEINFVFNNGASTWDNNNDQDWRGVVANCPGEPEPPTGLAITNPPSSIVVGYAVSNYTLRGIAEGLTGNLAWSNSLTGANGTFPVATPWAVSNVVLNVGSNTFTVRGTTASTPMVITNGSDQASNYSASWTNGSNQGTGFGPWTLNAGAEAGHFLNTPGWGLWSTSGNLSEAIRPFTSGMASGHTFRATFKNGWILESQQGVGLALRNAGGAALIQYYFNGGDTEYKLEDAGGARGTGVAWTDQPQSIAIHLTGPTNYQITVGTTVLTGSYTGTLAQARFWNWSGGTGSNYDFYVNNLLLTSPGTAPGVSTSATVTITRLEQDNKDTNGDGVPDWWYERYGYNPGIPNLAASLGPNGYALGTSYQMTLDPHDTSVPMFEVTGLNLPMRQVVWQGVGGRRYVVEFRDHQTAAWQSVATENLPAHGSKTTTDGTTAPASNVRHYRVRYLDLMP